MYDILEQVGTVQRAQKGYIAIMSLWERSENTDWGSSGHMEASQGLQRPNQIDNGRNEGCVWHIGAGWKHSTCIEVIDHNNITLGTPRKP